MRVLCVAASVGLVLLLEEGSRSNPARARQIQTPKPACPQRDCTVPTEIPSTQETPVGHGPGNRHFLYSASVQLLLTALFFIFTSRFLFRSKWKKCL